ncbi:MAG: tetratricopeptide repeat protein [Candidatus Omnitrophica bacterium]|nr:tetratricopeptide repeat protein [Candidatus Omnitrophota bacterium]
MVLKANSRILLFAAIIVCGCFIPPLQAVTLSKEQLFQVATLAARDGEYEKAAEFLKKVIELDPRFSPAYNSLGMVSQALAGPNSAAEALRYYELALQSNPDYVDALNNAGRLYYAASQFGSAEQSLARSLKLRPGQPDINLLLAWTYLFGQSRAEQAIKYFEQGLLLTDDAMAHYGLGLAHLLLDEKFKVFDQITVLRRSRKEELASRLEGMVRGNVKISSTPGTPLVTGVGQEPSLFDKELQSLTASGFKSGSEGKGMQVRLKGPLTD